MTEPLNLDEIKPWINPCGVHDYGEPMTTCTCPQGDPRLVMVRLVAEIKRLHGEQAGDESMITREEVLTEAYWKLREHASSYRGTNPFRKTLEAWEANRDDRRLYAKHVIHEFYARGIESAARDIAEMLGVPEHEIERDAPS